MSLLFCDGFGHVDDSSTDYSRLKWDTAYNWSPVYITYDNGYGSYGDWGFRVSKGYQIYMGKLLPATKSEIVVGCRFSLEIFSDSSEMLQFMDSANEQLGVRAMADGSIAVYRGSTKIAQSNIGLISTYTWFYFEIKVLFSQTVGTVDVQLNGASVISETALDTCNSTNESTSEVRLYSNTGYVYVDDFYICDTTGTENNDFMGDIKIETIYPTSDGNSTDFTPSTGTDHYALVDEPQLTADTDHNESLTIGHKDTYGMTDITTDDDILGVQICAAVKNTDAGTMNVRTICRSGTTPTDNEGADKALSQTITPAITVHEKEPTDDVAWTKTILNASEFGLKVQS